MKTGSLNELEPASKIRCRSGGAFVATEESLTKRERLFAIAQSDIFETPASRGILFFNGSQSGLDTVARRKESAGEFDGRERFPRLNIG